MKGTDCAYMAGLIDGEGSIGIDNHGGVRVPSVRVTVTNTDIDTLEDLKSLWGGCVSTRRQRHEGWKAASDLIWAGGRAAEVLRTVQPYLRIKTEQCRVALSFAETVNPPEHRTKPISPTVQWARQQMRGMMLGLNQRGVPISHSYVDFIQEKDTKGTI